MPAGLRGACDYVFASMSATTLGGSGRVRDALIRWEPRIGCWRSAWRLSRAR
jgi:hypothetical protein